MKKAPPLLEKKKIEIDFTSQKFCPKCGRIIEISRNKCNLCAAILIGIKAIGKSDNVLIPIALSALNDPSPSERKDAINSLEEFEETKILGLLTHILLNDPDEEVRREAANKIGNIHHTLSIEVLELTSKDSSESVRKESKEGLKKLRERQQKPKQEIATKKPTRLSKTAPILPQKKPIKKAEISGSITAVEEIKEQMPWIFGRALRKPKINFPQVERRRFSMPVPSKSLGLILIFIVLFVLQTGVVYLAYRNPPALGADQAGNALFLYPGVHDSFIIEGIVASILIFIASLGYIFLYQASKYVYNRKMALRILVFGLILVMIGFVALQSMIYNKLN